MFLMSAVVSSGREFSLAFLVYVLILNPDIP